MTRISYSNPINQAWLRMKAALFRPLDPGKWFVLGFTAWLAQLDPDWVLSFNFDGSRWSPWLGSGDRARGSVHWGDFSDLALPAWSMPLLISLAVIGLLIALVLLWIQCRGRFMFLDNLVHERAEVVRPWREQGTLGDSAFLWQVIFNIACLVVFGTLGVVLVLGLIVPVWLEAPAAGSVILVVLAGTFLFTLLVGTIYIQFFMNRFVIPLMYRERSGVVAAWRRFLAIFGENPLPFVLYGLVYLVLLIVGGLLILIAGLLTCCVGLLLVAIPYVGTVLTLPLPLFLRFLDLEFLAQFDDGGGLLAPLPAAGPQVTPDSTSTQIDGNGTVVRPADVGQDDGGAQSGPQDP